MVARQLWPNRPGCDACHTVLKSGRMGYLKALATGFQVAYGSASQSTVVKTPQPDKPYHQENTMTKFIFGVALSAVLCACGKTADNGDTAPTRPAATVPTTAAPESASALLSPPEPAPAELYAKQGIQLFLKGCIAHQGEESKVVQFAEQNRLLELSGQQKQQFNFPAEVNRVWGIHSQPDGRFFLTAGSHYCSVLIREADTATLQSQFTQAVGKLPENLLSPPRQVADQAIADRPETGQVLAYEADIVNTANRLLLAAYTDKSDNAGAQAMMVLRRLPQ